MSFNQEQVNQILNLQKQFNKAESAFLASLKEAAYVDVWTSSYEDTRCYKVHPDYAAQAEENSEFMGIKQEWLDTLPPSIVFEL
jgi:hypothetical protein